jgi:hypothetical protein
MLLSWLKVAPPLRGELIVQNNFIKYDFSKRKARHYFGAEFTVAPLRLNKVFVR